MWLPYDGEDGTVVQLDVASTRSDLLAVVIGIIATKDDFCRQLFGDEECLRGLARADLDDEENRPKDGYSFAAFLVDE